MQGKKKYSTEANTQTTSRQNLLSDMHGRPEFSQSALPTHRKLWQSKLLPHCLSGQILILNQAGLNRACSWGSVLPARQGALRFELYHFHLREVCLSYCPVKWEHRTAADSQTGTVFFMLRDILDSALWQAFPKLGHKQVNDILNVQLWHFTDLLISIVAFYWFSCFFPAHRKDFRKRGDVISYLC